MNYFAYGSNMNPERMKKRGINFSKRRHAILRGWGLEFNKVASCNPKEGYANIMPDENNIVEGVLYDISNSDLSKLDRYEGYPNHYKRIEVKVQLESGQIVEAVTYIAHSDKVRTGLKPSKEYLNHLLKGCNLLSKNYCERLRRLRLWETLD